MSNFIRYNYSELIGLQRTLEEKQIQYKEVLSKVETSLEALREVIVTNDQNNKDWIILMPSDFVNEINFTLKKAETNKKDKIHWKKLTLEILNKHGIPMNSELIYHKAKQLYGNFSFERRFAIKNISSALSNLYLDDVVYRITLNKGRGFLYGFSYMFNEKGEIKNEFMQTFKMEAE